MIKTLWREQYILEISVEVFDMPYMHIFKQAGKWHYGGTPSKDCIIREKPEDERKRVGGGPECGNDVDPPREEWCLDCFPFMKIKN